MIGPVDCPSGGRRQQGRHRDRRRPRLRPQRRRHLLLRGRRRGKANALSTDFGGAAHATDTPLIPAVGNPAFGAAGGAGADDPAFIMGAIGLFRALDLQVVDYQSGQDLLGVWDPASGQFRAGFPATVNDLQFLTGPAVADIDGQRRRGGADGQLEPGPRRLRAGRHAGQPAGRS